MSKYRGMVVEWIPLELLVLHVDAPPTKVGLHHSTRHTMRIFGFGMPALMKLDGTRSSKWQ